MKTLFVPFVIFVTVISGAIASTKNLSIDVALSPTDTSTIASSKIKGRDNHLKKKLGHEQDKKAVLLRVEAKRSNDKVNLPFIVKK